MRRLAHLFVYGTLQPGETRWESLRPYVVDDGREVAVPGELYDTGLDYPAARFVIGNGNIRGRLYALRDLDVALAHLDDVEGAVRGLYRRVVVVTTDGVDAWAYECGDPGLLARRIASGDWAERAGGDVVGDAARPSSSRSANPAAS